MVHFIKLYISLFLFLLQSGGISVESKVDRSVITIGDLVRYEIVVKRDKELKVEMPGLATNLGYFEIRDYEVHEPVKIENNIIDKVEYIISTYDTGNYVIPPLTLYYTGADSVRRALRTDEIKIRVESVKPSEAEDIKGLKFPLELLRELRRIILLSSAGLLIILIGVLTYFFYRKKKKGESIIPMKKKPEKPAHEIALESIRQLKDSKLLEQEKVKEYYIELSEIIRIYIGGRYFITALEMTTPEVVLTLRRSELDDGLISELNVFLTECDFVKFAKYIPSGNEIIAATERAFKFIEETKIELISPERKEITGEEEQQKMVEEEIEESEVK